MLVLGLGGCGSDPPGSVAYEQPAIDLAACAASASSCVRQGTVTTVESLVPGDDQIIKLGPGASITAPLQRPSPTTKLAYLVVTVRAIDTKIAVKIDGAIDTVILPMNGYSRTEVEAKRVVPGDTITIRSLTGDAELVYVEGRWND